MGKERATGVAILLLCALAAAGYALLLYLGYGSALAIFLVSAAFYILLGILGWIGWTMAKVPSTPAEARPETQSELASEGDNKRRRPKKRGAELTHR